MITPTIPPPSGPYQQPKSDLGPSVASGLDITAFVLAWFVPLLGAILGMVAVSEAHKQQRTASGLAVAAVVIGLLATLILVIVIIAVAAGNQTDPQQQWVNCLNTSIANGTPVSLCGSGPS